LLGQHVRGRAHDLAGLRPQVRRIAVVIDQRCDAEIEILIRQPRLMHLAKQPHEVPADRLRGLDLGIASPPMSQ